MPSRNNNNNNNTTRPEKSSMSFVPLLLVRTREGININYTEYNIIFEYYIQDDNK